jgi:hypothetical protein
LSKDNTKLYSYSEDNSIKEIDILKNIEYTIGKHKGAIKQIILNNNQTRLYSCSDDNFIKEIDLIENK